MSEITKNSHDFVGYEYKEISAAGEKLSLYLDSYQSFGWELDNNIPQREEHGQATVTLKRDRRIVNKAELTRLQQNFEACSADIKALEAAKTSSASVLAMVVGIIGTVFMALSVFSVTAEPPKILLCILFAVPAFVGWIAPLFLYRWQVRRKCAQLTPLIEEKYEEIYRLCERGHQLLPQ